MTSRLIALFLALSSLACAAPTEEDALQAFTKMVQGFDFSPLPFRQRYKDANMIIAYEVESVTWGKTYTETYQGEKWTVFVAHAVVSTPYGRNSVKVGVGLIQKGDEILMREAFEHEIGAAPPLTADQVNKLAEDARKQEAKDKELIPGESSYDHDLRMAILANRKQATEHDGAKQEEEVKQKREDQRREADEQRKAAEERANAERLSAQASRLFVANWKEITGKINPSSKLTVASLIEPSRVDPHQHYDLDQGSIFMVTFSRAGDEAPKAEPSSAQGLGDFSSLFKRRSKPHGAANPAAGDEGSVRNLKFRGWGVDNLMNLAGFLEKFESWSKTASDNKVTDVDKALGSIENPGTGPLQLTFSVDRSGVTSLRWEIGAVSFSQQGEEVKGTEGVIKSALDQVASLKAESLKRASNGEDIKSKEDLFK